MSRFDKHFKMNEADAIEYAKEKLAVFKNSGKLECKEIGDGNINYVFKVWDSESNESVIIKHADDHIRSSGGGLSTDRNRIEAEILEIQGSFAPGMVPEIYLYDPVMCCVAMEDLSDYEIMRYALLEYKTFDKFAEQITDFMVNTLLLTTDTVMDTFEKKEMVRKYINPSLCDISERLVYTEPFKNLAGRNKVIEENKEFVEREIYSDKILHLEAAKLKNEFKNNAQALIHGDLHTGSIFVKSDSTKVFDPEFAFFGPIGYDMGNVIGNLFFARVHAWAALDGGKRKEDFLRWADETITAVIELFKEKFTNKFYERVTDDMAKTDGFRDWYLGNILSDTAGCAGLEMCRRTVGQAKVKDITCIEDNKRRALAERILLLAAKDFIVNRSEYTDGEKYISTIKKVTMEIEG